MIDEEDKLDFVIPQILDDLQVFSDTQYYVQDVLTVDEIKDQYKSCKSELEIDGPAFIKGKFDLLYSAAVHFSYLPAEVIEELWKCSYSGLSQQYQAIKHALERDVVEIDDQERFRVIKHLKMNFYIFSVFMIKWEEKQCIKKSTTTTIQKRGKKGAVVNDGWSGHKNDALHLIYKILRLPLQILWRPEKITEDFLDQVSKSCLKMLDDREIAFVAHKDLRESVMQIITVLFKDYSFGLTLMPRIIQMIMLYEHLTAPFAQLVCHLERSDNSSKYMLLALKEITEDVDFINKSGHNCSNFIIEMGKEDPECTKKYINILCEHLEKDPYTMRQGVLEVFGNLILTTFESPELSEQDKREKDILFDYLYEHLIDVNAFCRSKALQMWKMLCEAEKIPKGILLKVVERVQSCVIDKGSIVRKDSIKLMKSFLEHNPFASKLKGSQLKEKFNKASERLKSMEQKAGISTQDPDVLWRAISSDITQKISDFLKNIESNGESAEDVNENDENETMLNCFKKITDEFKNKDYNKAIEIGYKLVDKFDTRNLLGVAKRQIPPEMNVGDAFTFDEQEEDSDDENDEDEGEINKKAVKNLEHLLQIAFLYSLIDVNTPRVTDQMQEELNKQRDLVKFLRGSIRFSEIVNTAVENVILVLENSQTTELVEAIDFIATAQQFELLSEKQGMTRLLGFIHSKDLNLKNAVTNAYKRIYLTGDGTHEGIVNSMQKLCALIQQFPLVYEQSLCELIQLWYSSGDISRECIDVLWDLLTKTKKEDSIGAANILHMILSDNPENVREQFLILKRFGFGKRGEECYMFAEKACKILSCSSPMISSAQDKDPYKINMNNDIFESLSNLVINGLTNTKDPYYCNFVDAAFQAIFQTCETPTKLVDSIIKRILGLMKETDINDENAGLNNVESLPLPSVPLSQMSQFHSQANYKNGKYKVSQWTLARVMFIIGSVARNLLKFLMDEVLVELRRHKLMADKKVTEKTEDGSGDSDTSISSNVNQMKVNSLTEEEAIDKIQSTCNREVLSEINLLGNLLPLVETICQHPKVFSNPELQIAAIQALGRCMMLSQTYCSKKLRLLCTLMLKSTEPRIRIAGIHCMGDLLKRFPNETDPYSPNIYKCLKDENVDVRREGLIILSKLILGDMLRVKFQISYLAACLTDTDQSCKDIASYFFATLATKGNILYNLVIDMISQLSHDVTDKSQEDFETIMRIVLPYITQERQVISLIEKLCSRFPEKTTEEECHNLALCISILQISMKAIKALTDAYPLYADKLSYPTVKLTFNNIIENARKHCRNEKKENLEEFDALINASKKKTEDGEQQANEQNNEVEMQEAEATVNENPVDNLPHPLPILETPQTQRSRRGPPPSSTRSNRRQPANTPNIKSTSKLQKKVMGDSDSEESPTIRKSNRRKPNLRL